MTRSSSRSGQRRLWCAIALAALASALALTGLQREVAAGATARASKAGKVTIANFEFKPGTLRVARGSLVTFANTSGVTHTATRAKGFDTGPIKPGKSVSIRFARKGTFAYHCTIHPSMHGKVIVE